MQYKNIIYIALSTLVCLFLALPASSQRTGGGGGGASASSSGSSSSSARPSGGGSVSVSPPSSGFSSRPSVSNNGGGVRPSFGGSAVSRPSFGGSGVSRSPSYGGAGISRSPYFQGGAAVGGRGPVYVDRRGNILRGTTNSYSPRGSVGYSSRGNYGIAGRAGVAGGISPRGSVYGGISSYRTVPRIGYGNGGGYWGDHGYYHFNHGYYGSYYLPRLGFTCSILPYGYYPFYYGDYQYYYSDGLFYLYNNSEYTVVEPPIGAEVATLPQNAQSIVINGQQYYELNGVYYQPYTKDDGTLVYQIVGKDGELNTNSDQDYQQPQGPQMGDLVSELPPDCRRIRVNGTKLYVSQDGVYYQQQVDANGNTMYKIVGLPSDEQDQNQ